MIYANYNMAKSSLTLCLALICFILCCYSVYILLDMADFIQLDPAKKHDSGVVTLVFLIFFPISLFLLSISFATIKLDDHAIIYKNLFSSKTIKISDIKNVQNVPGTKGISYIAIETEYYK